MTFQALLVSKDDEAIAVLSPVLSGFGVTASSCGYPEGLCRVTEEKFDAVIVDFDDPHSAALVLQNVSQASMGNNAITIALLSDKAKLRNVFGAGANFVLYKPISPEHAEASLKAATALIKRERRRTFRVAVQIPVQLRGADGSEIEGILFDLSEDGMDVLAAQSLCPASAISAMFNLPGVKPGVRVNGQIAWANPNGQAGVRFIDSGDNVRATLKEWISAHAQEHPPLDPEPVSHCKLTDLSLGGCYVETESPFPEHSEITLCLKAEDMEVEAEGMVRVMHPGFGMGLEFASHTTEERAQVARFIGFLTSRPGTVPELLITPRGLTAGEGYADLNTAKSEELDDPLLELLRSHESLSQAEFLQQLREQRNPQEISST